MAQLVPESMQLREIECVTDSRRQGDKRQQECRLTIQGTVTGTDGLDRLAEFRRRLLEDPRVGPLQNVLLKRVERRAGAPPATFFEIVCHFKPHPWP
jgi:hypothetical protein